MSVLVTGGAGFLGAHVVGVLAAAGSEPVVFDDLSTGRSERLPAGVKLIEGDVRDSRALREALGDVRPHAVVHLAARPFAVRRQVATVDDVDVNILGALSVVNATVAANVPHFVFASSAAVYGELSGRAAVESYVAAPHSANGVAKLAVEGFLRSAGYEQNVTVSILRFANLYGPGSTNDSVSAVHAFVQCVATDVQPVIDGNGGQTRDFLFVRDAARAVAAVLETRAAGVMNVGTGSETSIGTLLSMVAKAAGVKAPSPIYRTARPNDLRRSCLDVSRLFEATGYRPATTLVEGLSATVESRRESIFQV